MKLLRNLTRFSLSTILVVMFVCALGFAAINWRLHWYQEQESVAEEIRSMSVYLEMQPGEPAWLRQFASDRHFESIKAVSFQGQTRLDNSDLEILKKSPHLRVLSLHGTGVTDDGMKHLGQLKMLDTLSLKMTEVSDDGLAELAGLTNLIKL
jgi:hypothetical protein